MTAALELRDLVVSYRSRGVDTEVVHGVGYAVDPGETVAVVGESGSGKSTVALAALGLLPPNGRLVSGAVLLDGTDISGWSPRRLATVRGTRIGLIPQDPGSSLNPVRTIGSQLGEIFRIHRAARPDDIPRRVVELLDRVGLSQPDLRARQYPHELSGGMQQRVLIASAVALEPKVVIADEPTSALDVTVQRRVLDLLDELQRENRMGVVLVTHDLAVAAERADRIVVMRTGRVEETGPAPQLVAAPRSDYARRLVADAPAFGARSPVRAAATDVADRPLAVEVRGVTKVFRVGRSDFRAVDEVSFRVPKGTTHAIVGESGSGKTTTVRMLMGFESPTEGAVLIDGEPMPARRGRAWRAMRRRIQIVYQNPFASLDPSQSIGAILAEPMRNFGLGDRAARKARTLELLDLVALPADVRRRPPRELSGGQRQRVAIARALAADPEILVLDEAVSALDVTVQAQILALLRRLRDDLDLSYVFISHDLAVVRDISDSVSVMQRGRVVEARATADLFADPREGYTRDLIASIPSGGARSSR